MSIGPSMPLRLEKPEGIDLAHLRFAIGIIDAAIDIYNTVT